MVEGDLETKANEETPTAPTPAEGENIFDSIGSSLEGIVEGVKSVGSAIKKAAHYTYYTAKAAAGLAAGFALGGGNALILPAGIAAGVWLNDKINKQKTTFKKMANEVAIGGLLGGIYHYMLAGVGISSNYVKSAFGKVASLVAGAGLGIATIPPFLFLHEYLNRAFISDYKPQPLDIGKKLAGPMKYIIPPIAANFSLVPAYLGTSYQMPVAAGIATTYGLVKGGEKEENKQAAPAPTPQPNARPSPTS